jgi:hypothetical protein
LDLRLRHRRPDPRHLRIRDGSLLHCHFTARVRIGSNISEGLDMHVQEERGVERWCMRVAGRSRRLDGSAHAEVMRSQDRAKATVAEVRVTGGRRKGNGVNPESAHCGSFRRTTRLNSSIPRSSRED